MMINMDTLKDHLITELWLPIAVEGGAKFYPRLHKNKKMKLFSLTNDRNFTEIIIFEQQKLIQGVDAVAWVSTPNKRWRLESESVCSVLDGDIYSVSLLDSSCQLSNNFPFDIINFDFSSQDICSESKRIEREIEGLEKAINLQNQKGCVQFILLYTSILESNSIDKSNIIRFSDSIRINEWQGLNLDNFPQAVSDKSMKKAFVEEILRKIGQKYGYSNIKSNNVTLTISTSSDILYSTAGIFMR